MLTCLVHVHQLHIKLRITIKIQYNRKYSEKYHAVLYNNKKIKKDNKIEKKFTRSLRIVS